MSVALRGCEDFTTVYLDDILIFSNDLQQYHQHLQQVFSCLEAQRYHIRLMKCSFVQKEVPFLGHLLSKDGIKASEKRYDALKAFQAPFVSTK